MVLHTTIKGVQFHKLKMDDLLVELECRIDNNKKTRLAFSNPEFILSAQHSSFLMNYLNTADYNLADGVGVIWAARLYGSSLPERITGTDFTQRMAGLSAQKGYRIYFLGGKPGVASAAAERLKSIYPRCRIVGAHDGYFTSQQEDKIIESINSVHPDFLMVCLGNPRQEEWIGRNFDSLNAKVIFGNGGALDFASGKVSRAPLLIQQIGFEWLWRLSQDLSWSRLLRISRLPVFVIVVFLDFLRSRLKFKL